MSNRARPKLLDVARLAGVSPATVSRAISQPELLALATRERVRRAAQQLGYVPDAAARALASGRSGMVGVIVPTLENAVFARAIHHFQTGLAIADLQLVVASHEYDCTIEEKAIRSLITRGIDALVLVGSDRPAETWALLEASGVPTILTYTFHADYDSIGFDNARAGYLAGEHLVELGHRRIGFISGPRRNNDRMALRLDGVSKSVAGCGAELPSSLIVEQEFSLSGGKLGVHRLMSLSQPPTAIVAGNDMIAAGAVYELQSRGLRVPEDISVVGLEDLEIATFSSPTLTSVRLPISDVGSAVARHVIALLRKEPVARRVEFGVELVVRNSTGRVRTG